MQGTKLLGEGGLANMTQCPLRMCSVKAGGHIHGKQVSNPVTGIGLQGQTRDGNPKAKQKVQECCLDAII